MIKIIKESKLKQLLNPKLDRNSVEAQLLNYDIDNFTINPDGTVDVDGDVDLYSKDLDYIPFKFGKVTGDFWCGYNNLSTLENSPIYVGGNFDCSMNKLNNDLEYGPSYVGGVYNCSYNQLKSLKGSPKEIFDDFYCHMNHLTNLEYGPEKVKNSYGCSDNKLKSLKGSPAKLLGSFTCNDNKLTTLEGGPLFVGKNFYCNRNGLEYIKGAPLIVGGNFHINDNKREFTKEEIQLEIDVKGNILV